MYVQREGCQRYDAGWTREREIKWKKMKDSHTLLPSRFLSLDILPSMQNTITHRRNNWNELSQCENGIAMYITSASNSASYYRSTVWTTTASICAIYMDHYRHLLRGFAVIFWKCSIFLRISFVFLQISIERGIPPFIHQIWFSYEMHSIRVLSRRWFFF